MTEERSPVISGGDRTIGEHDGEKAADPISWRTRSTFGSAFAPETSERFASKC